jgi:hypothetical protein
LTWALLGAWTTILIHGLVDVPYFKNDLSVLWMLLVGLTILTPLVLSQQKRSNK